MDRSRKEVLGARVRNNVWTGAIADIMVGLVSTVLLRWGDNYDTGCYFKDVAAFWLSVQEHEV